MLHARSNANWLFVGLCSVIFLVTIKILKGDLIKQCPSETDDNITWPKTNEHSSTSSEPICLNSNLEISKRYCLDNQIWDEKPTCDLFQRRIENPCPDTSIQKGDLCIFVIKTSYPPICPYEETVPFEEYVKYVDEFPIWLPVDRENEIYGEGLFYWKEPTQSYKSLFDFSYSYDGNLRGKSCLLYHDTNNIVPVSCKESHTAICAYKILSNRSNTYCSQTFDSSCKQSNYSTKSTCFCKKRQEKDNFSKIELKIPYQNLLYKSLDEVCYIGLEKRYNQYVWINSNKPVEYTDWSYQTNFGEHYVHGAISSDGWLLKVDKEESKCTLVEKHIPEVDDKIVLTYDESSFTFTVSVTNPHFWKQKPNTNEPLLLCFTDVVKQSIIQKLDTIKVDADNTTSFSFSALDDQPGHYWCEGFLFPELNRKKSNVYLIKPTNPEYILILTHKYSVDMNPLSDKYLNHVVSLLVKNLELSFPDTLFHVRIFKIIKINEDERTAELNFHLTTQNDVNLYMTYSSLLSHSLLDFFKKNVLIYSTCMGYQLENSQGNTITWPTTQFGSKVIKPIESWCIDNNGTVVTRYCEGNFIDGAMWSEYTTCNQLELFSPTTILTNLLQVPSPNLFMRLVMELALDSDTIVADDVELISNFLIRLEKEANTFGNLTTFAYMIDSIMNIPRTVLTESQQKYNSTDKILKSIVKLVEKSNFKGALTTESLSIVSLLMEDFYSNSIIWRRDQEKITLEYRNLTETNVPEIDNFDSGIIFKEKLMENITSSITNRTKIIIIAYFKPTLFNEEYSRKYTSTVFSTILPDLNISDGALSDVILTVYNNDIQTDFYNCSYWKNGYWFHESMSKKSESKLICPFKTLTNVGLVSTTNVTDILMRIKNSDCDVSIRAVYECLYKYLSLFKSKDICIVNSILERCSDYSVIELPIHIINKILGLPMEIVKEVKEYYKINLLQTLESILYGCRESKLMELANIAFAVQILKNGNITGFYVDCVSNQCQVEITSNHSTIPSNSELYVIIDDKLLEQLLINNVEKVIIVLFATDVLFASKSVDSKSYSKVIGVLIPNFQEGMLGSIRTTYSVGIGTDNETCEYWESLWTRRGISMLSYGKYQCQFWTTGYYALQYDTLNVTELLENIINNPVHFPFTTLQNINQAANTYLTKLRAVDINIIGNFFISIVDIDNSNLIAWGTTARDVLLESVHIINTTLHVERDILKEAEKMFGATNKILTFLKNWSERLTPEESSEGYEFLCSNKLLVVILFLDAHAFSGLEMFNNNDFCMSDIISKGLSIFTTGIKLSDTLVSVINSTVEKPSVILTIFSDDVFFYEDNPKYNTNNVVFGIDIPQFNEYLSYSFSIFYHHNNLSDDLGCVNWQSADDNITTNGSWQVQRKIHQEGFYCNCFKQGWFTLWTQDYPINITSILQSITGATKQKLDNLESVSTYYDHFSAVDVHLLTQLLTNCSDLDVSDVQLLTRIVINYFKISNDVRQTSQIDFNSTAMMLDFFSKLATLIRLNTVHHVGDYVQLIACELVQYNAIVVRNGMLSCQSTNAKDYDVRLDYIHHQNETDDLGFFATVFVNKKEMFVNSENYDTLDIIGISVDSNDAYPMGKMMLRFDGSLPIYACVCWQYLTLNENGTWIYLKTIKTASETVCHVPNSKRCRYITLANLTISNMLKSIYTDVEDASNCEYAFDKLALTSNVIKNYRDQLQNNHFEIIVKILETSTINNNADVEYVADIINELMDLDRITLVKAQMSNNLIDKLRLAFDHLINDYRGEIIINNKRNFALLIKSDVSGIIFEQNGQSSHILKNIITNNADLNTSDVALLLSPTGSLFRVTIYFNDAFFIGNYNEIIQNYGIIVRVGISDDPLKQSLSAYFENYGNASVCSYWNEITSSKLQMGYWQSVFKDTCEIRRDIRYFAILNDYNVTASLQQINDSTNSVVEQLEEVAVIIKRNTDNLTPFDIHLIADIMSKVTNEFNVTIKLVDLISFIISNLFEVDRLVLNEAQTIYEATDSILLTTDKAANQCNETIKNPIIYNNFTIVKTDVITENITGLILDDCNGTICNIEFLHNKTLKDVLAMGELKTALVFSDLLLEQIRESEDYIRFIVTIHYHNNFFNEPVHRSIDTSHILGVLLEGLKGSFHGPMYLLYNINNAEKYYNTSCAYWKYKVHHIKGFWQDEVTPNRSNSGYFICEYNHLTHFVLLLASSSSIVNYLNESHILDIVTNINSVLSLLGLFGILLTAVLFDRWRNNTGNQILINFTVAISIKNVMLYISEGVYTENKTSMGCTITGGILHYSILSEFCWMLIIAILQFKRFVEVLGGPLKYVLFKACICGWVFPALPVFLIIIVDVNNYNASEIGLCYPSGFGLYLGVWLPLIVIISINFIIFIFILYNVFHKKTEYRDQVNHEILFQWRLVILLFSMLGLTWTFGFLGLVFNASVFAVFFCFMATLQGFIMFLFFIVFNKNTRYLYVQAFSWWMYSKGYKDRLN